MRKIINGKMYDTNTAKVIGTWSNYKYGDFNYCEETLYKKKTGEYFLYGEGGALSKYAKSCGNNDTCGGSEFIPLSKNEAKKWMECNTSAEKYIAEFGEVEE